MQPTLVVPPVTDVPVRRPLKAEQVVRGTRPSWLWLHALLVLLPLGFVGMEVAAWVRNVPRWDEFDTALDLLISLDSGLGIRELIERLAAVQNEHRMLVSRALFAASYGIWGGINFAIVAVIGNLFLVVTLALLVTAVPATTARFRLAAILALSVLQLQHHENLFWGGASIDHFFVLLASVAALRALTGTGRRAIALGITGAFLATFSLAHGLAVWPVGLALLCRERRWPAAAAWLAAAVATLAMFLTDFRVNPAHRLPGWGDLETVGEFWLRLIGSSPALGNDALAPWLGAGFIVAMLCVAGRGCAPGERLAIGTMAWCLAAMGMVAWGRALLSPEWMPVTSRYFVVSSLAWASLLGVAVERLIQHRGRSARWWWPLTLAGLACFNIAADLGHLGEGRAWARSSEAAVHSYHRHGTFAKEGSVLYPDPERADALVAEAQRRGLYRLPAQDGLTLLESLPIALDDPAEIDDAVYFIEEVTSSGGEMSVRGWAFRPDHASRVGELAVIFRSADELIAFDAVPVLRPDVAEAFERSDAAYAGFELRIPAARLPPGLLGIGVCFDARGDPEYMMTASTVMVPEH